MNIKSLHPVIFFLLTCLCIDAEANGSSTINPQLTYMVGEQKRLVDDGVSETEMVRKVSELYGPLRSTLRRSPLSSFSDNDLELLFDAANRTSFYAMNAGYESDMVELAAELDKRRRATSRHLQVTYDALIAARQWEFAMRWSSQFSGIQRSVGAPRISGTVPKGSRQVLIFTEDSITVAPLTPIDAGSVSIIAIIHPQCHFSIDAIASLRADPATFAAFNELTIWLTPQKRGLDVPLIVEWNRQNPDIRLRTAYRSADFPEIDSWETPTFYFFKSGRQVAKVIGWPHEVGLQKFKSALVATGVLQPPDLTSSAGDHR